MDRHDTPSNTNGRLFRLLIVDSRALDCTGLKTMFQTVWYVEEVVTATGAEEAVRRARKFRPDVVLMNMTLPPPGALEAARQLQSRVPGSRVLFLDDSVRPAHVRGVLAVGGLGYWTRHATFEEIVEAVRLVAAGRSTFRNPLRPAFPPSVSPVRAERHGLCNANAARAGSAHAPGRRS
jgi:DNA-binding NarL/FixJ family response regulator